MFSPELQSKLALFRAKCADGSIQKEELMEAVAILRQERKGASEASAKRRAKAKAAVLDADSLLESLK